MEVVSSSHVMASTWIRGAAISFMGVLIGCSCDEEPRKIDARPTLRSVGQAIELVLSDSASDESRTLAYHYLSNCSHVLDPNDMDRVFPVLIHGLVSGSTRLNESRLRLLGNAPYRSANASDDEWASIFELIFASDQPVLLSQIPKIVLHRLPRSRVGREVMIHLCRSDNMLVRRSAYVEFDSLPRALSLGNWFMPLFEMENPRSKIFARQALLRAEPGGIHESSMKAMLSMIKDWPEAQREMMLGDLVTNGRFSTGLVRQIHNRWSKARGFEKLEYGRILASQGELSKAQVDHLVNQVPSSSERDGGQSAYTLFVHYLAKEDAKRSLELLRKFMDASEIKTGIWVRNWSRIVNRLVISGIAIPSEMRDRIAEEAFDHLLDTAPSDIPCWALSQLNACWGWNLSSLQDRIADLSTGLVTHPEGWVDKEVERAALQLIVNSARRK